MKLITNLWIRSSSLIFVCSLFASMPVLAEVTADGTTSTTVTSPDGDNFTIDDGDRAGGNLFHSFQDFSVPTNGSAFFNNADAIENIFSRVTGGNISSIDGLIRANGSANLFLINPAGIIFGRNARLDIGGSFLGSTADSILFPNDVAFSAGDLQPPILTINAPIGLGIRDNPGDIVNTSVGQNPNGETNVTGGAVGLQVPAGETLAIVGGDVLLDDGNLTAKGGHIEIGSVRGSGEIGISETETGLVLDYDSINSFGEIRLENTAIVDVTAEGGGSINVNAQNINILGGSSLNAGIGSGLGSTDSQAGDITLNATNSFTLTNSRIRNLVNSRAVGNSGNIFIRASEVGVFETLGSDVDVASGSFLDNGIFAAIDLEGRGTAGNLKIISERLNVSGNGARISTATLGQGNSGNLTIETGELLVQDGGQIGASTFGNGNSGDLLVKATNLVEVTGESNFPSGLFAQVNPDAEGSGGNLTIETPTLKISDGARVAVSSFGLGNAGNLTIRASDIEVFETPNKNFFRTGIFANITASNSPIAPDFQSPGEGEAGNLTIETERLTLRDGGQVSVSTSGVGNAGSLIIKASESVTVEGIENPDIFEGSRQNISTLSANVNEGASGTGGSLLIETQSLKVADGGNISVSTFGEGDAGDLNIKAFDSIVLSGEGSGLFAEADPEAQGQGGSINVQTGSLSISDRAQVSAATAFGEGGNITLKINDNLILQNNSLISAQAFEDADGGNIDIDAKFIIAFPSQFDGNDIIASAAQGQGGNINITTEALFGIQERPQSPFTNDINASSEFGLDGNISINTPDVDLTQGVIELPKNIVELETISTQACSNVRGVAGASSLTITGKGGVPPEPTEPLSSDAIYIEGEQVTSEAEKEEEKRKFVIQVEREEPFRLDEIVPARGMIIQENGDVILTAYPTDNVQRTPHNSNSCGKS